MQPSFLGNYLYDGYLYVDKTSLIYQLVKTGSYYSLRRPRRFGKSLLLSTIHAYFDGKRELFEGLAIEKLEQDWVKRPVLHLDLNTQQYDTPQSLHDKLNRVLVEWESFYGAFLPRTPCLCVLKVSFNVPANKPDIVLASL